jgi:hypothetical protein
MSDENPTWDDDISGFFTQLDTGCMRDVTMFNPPLDLSDYESVKSYAARIYPAVQTGRMPKGDRRWEPEKVAIFKKWIDTGTPKSST